MLDVVQLVGAAPTAQHVCHSVLEKFVEVTVAAPPVAPVGTIPVPQTNALAVSSCPPIQFWDELAFLPLCLPSSPADAAGCYEQLPGA